jgi:FtsP/CotA-like multicopper oxidase with cupredoxin domain
VFVMRARVKRAIVPVLVLAASAATLVGIPAAAQTDSPPAGMSSAPSLIEVAATVDIDLCAKTGTQALVADDPATPSEDESVTVPIWGLAMGDCDTAGPAALPGPVLNVDAGDLVNITLHNSLDEAVSLVFPGQELAPDFSGAAANGGTALYSFTASDPGTYAYAAGTNPDVQVPMGLYGALVVDSLDAGTAYGSGTGSAFNRQAVIVLSEVDASLNADPGGFDPRDWHPTYWLINGKPYDPLAPPATILASQGANTLLRYVNAGVDHHTMMLLGLHQHVIAKDAALLNAPFDAVSETIPAGQTADMIVAVPGAASLGQTYALYSRNLNVTNGAAFPGGMLAFLEAAAPAVARPGVGDVPDIATLAASSKGNRVRIAARTVACSPCKATARLRAAGSWRSARMSRAGGTWAAVFDRVPDGRRAYLVTIRDLDSGVEVTSQRRFLRVR